MDKTYAKPWFCFLLGFIIPYAFTWLSFVEVVRNFAPATHFIVSISIISFLTGLLVFSTATKSYRKVVFPASQIAIKNQALFVFLIAWFALAVAAVVFEFIQIGGIPLFMGNLERLRFDLAYNGYVHLVAISLGLVSACMFYLARYETSTRRVALLALAVFGILFLALTGNRSDSGIFIAFALVGSAFVSNLIIKFKYVAGAVVGIVLFSGLKFYREISYGTNYIGMIMGQIVGEVTTWKVMLYPTYMTMTYNFSIFDRLVKARVDGITGGDYTFYSVLSLLPNRPASFGEFKNAALGIKFYAELTSTYISNFYVDFGIWGVVIGSFIMSQIIAAAYLLAYRDRRFVLAYALIYTHFLLLFYVFIYIYLAAILYVAMLFFVCYYFLGHKRSIGGSSGN